ncbi:hypothetical protein [Kaistella carnis]|uniref:hypothetical protein n=1 Tax=Kaistella carnis TaxID=1241979 RepID=UPI00289952A0|nr:hypothetical protein [Kaistella carnis]
METWEEYREELEKYREELENDNFEVEQDVIELEEKIEMEIYESFDEDDAKPFKKLLKELKVLKEEFDFYDEQAERDMMNPNGDDEDFD